MQCLQTEYDQLERKYETEKARAAELERSLQKAAEELSQLRVSAVDWSEEKEKLSEKCEQLSEDVNVCSFLLGRVRLCFRDAILFTARMVNLKFAVIICRQ